MRLNSGAQSMSAPFDTLRVMSGPRKAVEVPPATVAGPHELFRGLGRASRGSKDDRGETRSFSTRGYRAIAEIREHGLTVEYHGDPSG